MDEEMSLEWRAHVKLEWKSFFFCIKRTLLDSQMFSCRHKINSWLSLSLAALPISR